MRFCDDLTGAESHFSGKLRQRFFYVFIEGQFPLFGYAENGPLPSIYRAFTKCTF